jgi:mono/diheme cytochrome c family protein
MVPVIPRTQSFLSILLLTLAVLVPAAAQAPSSGNTKADEQAGALLFRDKGCSHCHGVGGIGTKKAPALTDLRKNKLWTPDKITDQILNGGQKMPPFSESLTDSEAAQLVAYLRAKHKPAPPPEPTAPAPAPAQ